MDGFGVGVKPVKSVSGNSPTAHLYFFPLVEPQNSAIVVPVRKRVVLWESKPGTEFTLPCS